MKAEQASDENATFSSATIVISVTAPDVPGAQGIYCNVGRVVSGAGHCTVTCLGHPHHRWSRQLALLSFDASAVCVLISALGLLHPPWSRAPADLTLIDLPGIVRTNVAGQSADVVKQVNDLINKYVIQNRTIMLAVIPANVDIATVSGM